MEEGDNEIRALLERALKLLDERRQQLPAIHVCQALELLQRDAHLVTEPRLD